MRTIAGDIILPPNVPEGEASRVVVEVRDVSLADAPSKVVATQELKHVALTPNGRVAFALNVPEVESTASLAFRVHVDIDGSGKVVRGDLLTTSSQAVPPSGESDSLEVTVRTV